MALSKLGLLDDMMRDMFPLPGRPTKQWVLDIRTARTELERTGRRVAVAWHLDNCGSSCRNVGPSTLLEDMRTHDCCGECENLYDAAVAAGEDRS